MQEYFSMINESGVSLPRLPFKNIKNDILGKNYNLSMAFVREVKSQKINSIYRKKDKPTNVLSFSLSKKEGELILCPAVMKKEISNLDRTFKEWLGFLVIHGMLHLKGMKHGKKMEKAEKKYLSRTKFSIR